MSKIDLTRAASIGSAGILQAEYGLSFPAYAMRMIRAATVAWLIRSTRNLAGINLACIPRDYIGKNIIANGAYEDLILRCLFEQAFRSRSHDFSKSVALDIGANIGNHACWFARHFRKVIAFEPNPICIKLFEANVMLNSLSNVSLVPMALSDHDGSAVFYSNLGGNLGGSGLSEPLKDAGTQAMVIELHRGDSLLPDHLAPDATVSLVKIDVEGHEHAVILGLEETIKKHKPVIMFESSGAHGENGSHAIVDTLSGWGYDHVYLMNPDGGHLKSRTAKLLYRIAHGYRMLLVRVVRPEDRYYSLIVASPGPL